MTLIYFILDGKIVGKENIRLTGYPRELLLFILSHSFEKFGGAPVQVIYNSDGYQVQTVDKEYDYLFIIQGTEFDRARELIDTDRYIPPPIDLSMDISPLLRHRLVEMRKGSTIDEFNQLLERERLISINLLRILTNEEGELDMEFQPSVVKAVIGLRGTHRTDNVLYQTFTVLGELQGYVRMAEQRDMQRQCFLSILYFKGEPTMIISTTIMLHDQFEQQRITRLPSAWIRSIEEPECESKGLSLLLHSITSYSMVQLFPNLKYMEIPAPFKAMAKILENASKKYDFTFVERWKINVKTGVNWINLWKQWTRPCVACLVEPAEFTCGGIDVCGEKCARQIWPH